jgi:hypothetical protein
MAPVPPEVVNKIKKWLSDPAAFEFQKVIASLAAVATINVGNKSLSDEEHEKIELQDDIVIAKLMNGVNKIIDEMRSDSYKFELVTLHPQLVTQTKAKE